MNLFTMAQKRLKKPHERKNNPGKPALKVTEWHLDQLRNYEGPGTITDIARALHVSPHMVNRFIQESDEFGRLLTETKARVDDKVESALLKRAVGYEFEHRKIEQGGKDENGNPQDTKVVTQTIHVQPDVGAQKLWLTNRRRDRWTERKTLEVEHRYQELLEGMAEVIEGDYEEIDNAEEE
jgi:hypothetical protein